MGWVGGGGGGLAGMLEISGGVVLEISGGVALEFSGCVVERLSGREDGESGMILSEGVWAGLGRSCWVWAELG